MKPALNAWTFDAELSVAEQIAATARAGFAGIELVVGGDGPLTAQTPRGEFVALGRLAADAGLQIVSLATGDFWNCHYASPTAMEREGADALTLALLDQAAACGAGAILVVPAVVGRHDEPRGRVPYSDALNRTLDALRRLRHEAEDRGVVLALENVWNRFLLSPVEAADLVDRVGSPYVGFYLDAGNVMAYGYPEDWIRTLGRRIARVHVKDYKLPEPGAEGGRDAHPTQEGGRDAHPTRRDAYPTQNGGGFCPLGEGSVDWVAVTAALREVGYGGPLTYEGPGDPAEICRRLRRVMSGQHPLGEGLA